MQIGKQNWPYIDKSLGFNIPAYTSIDLDYTGSLIWHVYYKYNGVLVATLTLTYDGSNNLTNVTQT